MIPGIFAAGAMGQGVDGDPYWANVVSLLHFDGSNGSTTFTDQKGITWSRSGDTKLSTEFPLFGSACGLWDGSNDKLWANHSDFNFGDNDFVIELAVRATTLSSAAFLFDFRPQDTNGVFPCLFVNADGSLVYFVASAARITTASGTLTTGVYHRVALERFDGITTLYVDGTARGSWSDSTIYSGGLISIGAGNQSSVLSLNGRIDEWRVTKGVARYKGNFTPPGAPFPSR